MNKFLVVVIALLFMAGIIRWFVPFTDSISSEQLLAAGEDPGVIMMLAYGTFMNSRLFRAAKIFIGLIVLGAAFKILHLIGGEQLLIFSFGGLFVVYVIHFIKKKKKGALDILKVILLFAFSGIPPFVLFHLISWETIHALKVITHVLFATTFGLFLYQGYKDNFASEK